MYFALPAVWALMFAYSRYSVKNIQRRVAAGEGPQMFHDAYAGYFSSLEPGERITHVWIGLPYEGPVAYRSPVVAAISYVLRPRRGWGAAPKVHGMFLVLTTHGRLVVALDTSPHRREQSFSEVASFNPGVYAVDVGPEHPAHGSGQPANPFDPYHPLQLTAVTDTEDRSTLYWLVIDRTGVSPSLSAMLPKPEGLPSQGRMS